MLIKKLNQQLTKIISQNPNYKLPKSKPNAFNKKRYSGFYLAVKEHNLYICFRFENTNYNGFIMEYSKNQSKYQKKVILFTTIYQHNYYNLYRTKASSKTENGWLIITQKVIKIGNIMPIFGQKSPMEVWQVLF